MRRPESGRFVCEGSEVSTEMVTWLLLAMALIAANLPWMSDRILFFRTPVDGVKRFWWRWLEWLLLYFIVGGIAIGLEVKQNGTQYPQGWEFYAVTVCLFLVLAFPGFIYRFGLKPQLERVG